MVRRVAVVAVLALVAVLLPGTVSAATPVRVLQLNICHSGAAGCFTGDEVMARARSVIGQVKPQVLSVNEACSGDVEPLRQAMGAARTKFVAAQRPDGSPVKCANGQDYGNAIMVAEPLAGGAGAGGRYRSQDSGNEKRVWACLPAGRLSACSTHLSARDAGVAFRQCTELMSRAVEYAARAPVVVSGDMNLRYGGSPDVQDCNRSGFYRKGDDAVQHVFATKNLTFVRGQKIDMAGTTDHPAWLVTVDMA
ncbi:endonuclease/exonuclease/phosphatase family protein [Qaidamihabitans albus]|uniref:endonuclease/exonuclease/phosphatase family protein n=1 Tax=Qaidamihabitans albus TaxID=2795733 RepID=UPI0018F26F1C|nr:endonuclease/exonuclease/phosphatase family protein [Qaidamihabitans albus]